MKCDLHLSARSIGIPTRLHTKGPENAKALLVIGDRPGVDEDAKNMVLVGQAGKIFDKVYVRAAELSKFRDVYVTNAVRCLPVKDANVTTGQYKACKGWLIDDLEALRNVGYTDVCILGAGAGAARTLRNSTLEEAVGHQGETITLGDHQYVTFYTNNPAMLLPTRNPSECTTVADHLSILVAYLEFGEIPMSLVMPTLERDIDDPESSNRICVDLETYGFFEGLPEQTVFHPHRSVITDKCPIDQLIQTAAISWRMPNGELRTSTYDMQHPRSVLHFWRFVLASMARGNTTFLGMNTPFDVSFLRYVYGKGLLSRRSWTLQDLAIRNYLHSELRKETSLKTISPLLMVTDFEDEKKTRLATNGRYGSSEDPNAHYYNAKDTVATLLNDELLCKWIARDYPGSNKLSDFTQSWYSRLLWWAIGASERGVCMNRNWVETITDTCDRRAARLVKYIQETYHGNVKGKGSDKWLRRTVEEAVHEAKLIGDRRIEKTKGGKYKADDESFNVCLGNLDPYGQTARRIRSIQRYKTLAGAVSRYGHPLLIGRPLKARPGAPKRKKGEPKPWTFAPVILDNHIAYPNWHVTPGKFEDAGSGGTKQGRITCRNPGLMNLSKPYKRCLYTRFSPGFLGENDLSQIELRVAALCSGDPIMLSDYQNGADRHLATGLIILNELREYMLRVNTATLSTLTIAWLEELLSTENITKATPGIKPWRMLGKTLNFAMLFKAGPKKLQETATRDNKISLPLDVWQRIHGAFAERHRTFISWQNEWVASVIKRGYAELPVIGQSRLFIGGKWGTSKKINEIANQPIQTLAANAMLDAVCNTQDAFEDRGMESQCNLIIYDATYPEGPLDELDTVQAIMASTLTDIPFWHLLEKHYGRTCPVETEFKVLQRRT